ncbi:3'3'-cGAMP-specific phosphodiesterase 2 [Paenibacillus plantiphilus]|uniref:3'3'-cGAMP-specific phosphodiesterase 2 n=1 Tax=Paenibacillus plantiphilus TaxID=2905650 RepID=A0ABN8H5P5_9BACL|nr:HD domain-containing phosphohydrolase [Paenibacillus plantiphilus]CAH1221823.1 3'3'-cGAMP-specific phosphodiesterase 2 [Paenibacillus plantiphilus]
MNSQLHTFLSLADAVIITDESHTILAVNETYERVTGYSASNIVGKKAAILRSPYTPKETHNCMKEAIHSGRPWSGVFTNYKQNQELWHSSITITPFDIDGELYFVGMFRELEQLASGYYLDDGRVRQIQGSLLKVLAISCEIRDPGIESHLLRVRQLTEKLVLMHNDRLGLGMVREAMSRIAHASILHDIGKSSIPEGILYKPGPLAHYERTIIEMHTLIGVDILDKIYAELNDELFESELSTAKNIILHHHEKWDGTGYPHGLQGSDIPLEARIVSVVDVFDALTSKRPYKEKWSVERSIQYLIDQRGQQFDSDIVDSFVALFEDGQFDI